MSKIIYPFGYEISFLNESIDTATHKKYNLTNKNFIKLILRVIGLPHFGARLRAYHLNIILNETTISRSSKWIDAGCGIGLNTFLLARKGYIVTGVDNDKVKISRAIKMLKKASYKNTYFKTLDLVTNKLPQKTFDSAICFEVLEHIKEDDKALKNIAQALKKQGTLILSVPGKGVISRINKECKDHVREGYSLSELELKLKKQRFKIKQVIKIEHTFIGFIVRYINDEIGRRSLLLVTILFPIFLPLAIIDSFLPELITPNNWIIVAKKTY